MPNRLIMRIALFYPNAMADSAPLVWSATRHGRGVHASGSRSARCGKMELVPDCTTRTLAFGRTRFVLPARLQRSVRPLFSTEQPQIDRCGHDPLFSLISAFAK